MIDIQLIIDSLPLLLQGMLVTLQIAGISCGVGLSLGTLLALIQTSHIKLLRGLVTLYVTIIRGTPMLIQILCAFYILPQFGISIPAIWTAIIAISLNSAAYISQIIKAGIASIDIGQVEAGRVLGLTPPQIARYIVLPQAFRVVLPALGNEFITLVKDSSLASIIGVAELSKQGRLITSRTYDAITVFFAVAVLYLLITSTISLIISKLEQRTRLNAKA